MSRVAGSLKKILMFVCGFRVRISLNLVVAEMYFYIKKRKCVVIKKIEYSWENLIVG